MTIRSNIAGRFDQAAETYDAAASVQARIAAQLVKIAAEKLSRAPDAILDIGSGTGFATVAAAQNWPQATVTAIDAAPGMLRQAQRKIPHLRVIKGDIAERQFEPSFDLIVSSMALHWLPQPRAALDQWRGWLKPNGNLFAATLIEGSFQEWRDLCAAKNLPDGLWNFPRADFAAGLDTEEQSIRVAYPSAKDFLQRLKATGAATPRADHRPFTAAVMRKLLARAPQPFPVTYRVLYIKAPSSTSI